MSIVSFLNYSGPMTTNVYQQKTYSNSYLSKIPNVNKIVLNTIINICEDIKSRFGFEKVKIAGGFPAAIFCSFRSWIDSNKLNQYYNDIDVYYDSSFKSKFDALAKIDPYFKQNGILFNVKSLALPDKEIQFIPDCDALINEICNSFDLEICKTYITYENQSNITLSVVDDLYNSLSNKILELSSINAQLEHKSFERLDKYLKRYDFLEHVKMPKNIFEKYLNWYAKKSSSVEKTETKELFNQDSGKEICITCKTELKWSMMQLKCPTCNKVYAG